MSNLDMPAAAAADASRDRGVHGPQRAAFAGWLSTKAVQVAPGVRVVTTAHDETTLIDAPGLRISLDPGQVGYDVSDSSITLWMGSKGHGGASLQQLAQAAARRIAQRADAPLDWLRGRFALVSIDLHSRAMLLASDRFGVHPLCYAVTDERVCFSDRADSVLPAGERQLDPQAIYNYVYFHVIPAPRTIFRNVLRLEPAQAVRVTAQGAATEFWWRPHFEVDRKSSFGDLKARFRDLVRNAVAAECTDGKVGSYLSGGTDSSTITGFLREVAGSATDAFSIGFDAAGYDEMAYARIAARRYGANHHEYYITPDDLVRSIPAVARHYDQPFGNSSALPAFYCGLQARQGGLAKVLAGDGGDELFGGNTRYAKQKTFDAYQVLPASLRRALIEPLLADSGWARHVPILKKGASYALQARVPMPDRMETYNLLQRFGPATVFTPAFLAQIATTEPLELQRSVYLRTAAPSIVDRMLAYDWRFTLADNDLPKVTGTAQMAGIDVGFPFLDDDLVDFSMRLSPQLKVRGLTLRYFFKEALRGFLPDEIIRKRKHGFGLPFGPWLERSTSLRAVAHDSLERLAARGIIQSSLAQELLSQRLREHAGYFGEMIWILMMLEQWLAAYAPEFVSE